MAHITQGFEWLRYQIVQTAFAIVADIENETNYEGLLLVQATFQNRNIASTKALILKNQ
jgi:hypothetical protein